jgi:ribosome maturation protein SDO1
MVDIDKAIIARYRKEGETFEILVDCDKALEYREGKEIALEDVLATNDIFSDVKKDERQTAEAMKKVFGTENPDEIADLIIKKGEVQLTADHKNKLRDEKKKKIVNIIHRNAIDPKTGLPHPSQRIEMVIEESRVKIDEFLPAEAQVKDIVRALTPLLPIKFEIREVAVKLPAAYAAKSYHTLKEFGKLLKDEWQTDGSMVAVVELPAGLQEEFESEIYKLTQGEAEIKILNKR